MAEVMGAEVNARCLEWLFLLPGCWELSCFLSYSKVLLTGLVGFWGHFLPVHALVFVVRDRVMHLEI